MSGELVWPCTIIPARYGGIYEGGRWLAFNKYPTAVPKEVYGDDTECAEFFENATKYPIGVGATPEEALDDLRRAMPDVLYLSFTP